MSSTELHNLTIAEASERVEKRELSSVELTEALLNRIEEVQSIYHPYITVTAERALDDAKAADEKTANNEHLGPLHGIPLGIKDIFNTGNVATESGAQLREGFVPDHDGAVAGRFREAGAVLLGKTVTQEFAYGVVSHPAKNAWDPERIPGGSSGGSGVAIALGAALGAVGSDTGGSIRIPASLNGIVGLKPTLGRVSKYGTLPVSWTLDTVGPMTKTAEDSALILGVLAGYDERDPTSSREPVSDYLGGLTQGLDGLRVGVPTGYFFEGIAPDIEAAVREAIEALGGAGAHLVEVETPLAEYAVAANMTTLVPEATQYHRDDIRKSPEKFGDDVRIFVELGEFYLATDYIQALRVRGLIKRAFRDVFVGNRLDVLVTPSLAVTALGADEIEVVPEEGEDEGTFGGYVQTTMPFNQTGQPAASVPCGFDDYGIPIGLQIVGRPFDEATVLQVAHGYEQITDWHTQRPPV
jgi:aspartyl-tRNA(Asn)/glutamyl-tRNA(Gln) amidotransferase subunit A